MSEPKWIRRWLSENEVADIEEAVARAEKKTSGEIVPMIVKRSSTVGHIPLVLFLFFLCMIWLSGLHDAMTHWFELPWFILLPIYFVVLSVVVWLTAPLGWIQRIFTPKSDQAFQVETRALNEFYSHRLHNTKASTGILLMISLTEHLALVYGDEAINQKVSESEWELVVDEMVKGIKRKDLAGGYIRAIEHCGEILKKHFPVKSGDRNELPNQLIVKD